MPNKKARGYKGLSRTVNKCPNCEGYKCRKAKQCWICYTARKDE